MKHAIILWLLLCSQAMALEIKPFTTDGCSAFPDGTLMHETLWLQCCLAHDYAYWKGGTYSERVKADDDLKACVANTGEDEISLLMLVGVRVGGTPFLPTEFRWGYGWQYLRGYKALSPEESAAVRRSESGS
jgi:hypothetical protein